MKVYKIQLLIYLIFICLTIVNCSRSETSYILPKVTTMKIYYSDGHGLKEIKKGNHNFDKFIFIYKVINSSVSNYALLLEKLDDSVTYNSIVNDSKIIEYSFSNYYYIDEPYGQLQEIKGKIIQYSDYKKRIYIKFNKIVLQYKENEPVQYLFLLNNNKIFSYSIPVYNLRLDY